MPLIRMYWKGIWKSNKIHQTKKKLSDIYNLSLGISKDVKEEVAKPISLIIETDFRQVFSPKELKIAKTLPIHTVKGNKNSSENYRLIAVLLYLSKIFETITKNRMLNLMEKKHFNRSQHGYGKK